MNTPDLFASTGAEPAQTRIALVAPGQGKPAHRRSLATSARPAQRGAPAYRDREPARDQSTHSSKNDTLVLLRQKRNQLQESLTEANNALDAALGAEDPLRQAFHDAHRNLRALNRTDAGKATILAAYDRRMIAGHAWDPIRRTRREAERWKKEILDELANVNRAIERA